MTRTTIGTTILRAFTAIPLTAQERKITAADLPAAVRATAQAQSRGATVRGYSREVEHGRGQDGVEMLTAGRSRGGTNGAAGTAVEIEQQVAFDSLPGPVRTALLKKAGKGRITGVESLTKGGTLVAYEAAIVTAGKRSEVQVGPDGTALTHEE